MMNLQDWYIARAYDLLADARPVPFDRGKLCDSKCCRGTQADGMILFPGEERRFACKAGYIVKDTSQGKILICSGVCNRAERPLACRIFPLFPYVVKNGDSLKITVLKDTRALGYCPLCDGDVSLVFSRKIRLAARSLLRDKQCADFLLELSARLTDFGEL